jgi:hypothetical protein
MDDLTCKVEQVSRVKARVASAMPASRSMLLKDKLKKIIERWPLALVAFGGVLTLGWLTLLIWLPLRLLQLV